MKQNVFILSILCVNLLFAQNTIDAKGRKQGTWIKKLPQSNVIDYTGQFKDDAPFGTFVYYFPTGKKKAEVVYKSNNTTFTTMFHENETILAQGKFINQLKDSTWSIFSKSGRINTIENYKLGQLHGERLVFYPLGNSETKKDQITQKQFYINGKLHGKQIAYFENGKIWKESNYEYGEKNGEEITYSPYGNIELKDYYYKGLKNGWCMAYDSLGSKVTGKIYYNLGKRLDSLETIKYLGKIKLVEQKKLQTKPSKLADPKK